MADTNTSDPYVLVSVHEGSSQTPSGGAKSGAPDGLISYSKSKTIANTLNPTWNQDIIVFAVPDCKVALTIMDSDLVSHDDFMGQVEPFALLPLQL